MAGDSGMTKLALTFDRAEMTVRRNPDGTVTFNIPHAWCCGTRLLYRPWLNHYINEHLRKGLPSVHRTHSRKFRAGTRRTKRYAHAAR